MEHTALTKERLLDFLASLEDSRDHYLTMYLQPSSLLQLASDSTAETGLPPQDVGEILTNEAFLQQAHLYQTGGVVFWSAGEHKCIALPPFVVLDDRVFHGRPETSPLRLLLERERILGVLLVTWGSYAIGIFNGDVLVESKVGTGYIQKRHRKGGRSQKRFARRIEEQKGSFLRRVADRVEERLNDVQPEQLFFGGNRLILKPLLQENPRLQSQAGNISKRFLNVRSASSKTLLGSLDNINQSVVFSY
jgi:hypothetical protein